VNAYLLDVNVLVALAWPTHVLHERVSRWFGQHAQQGWASCPFTQSAFVRLLSNPAFSPAALSVENAASLLKRNLEHPAHHFWAADITLRQALETSGVRLDSHRQITDAYLLGLAFHKKGRLATCDGSLSALLSEGCREKSRIELIA
jgi:toxin-antitoxin system PIN domain toxin